MTPARMARRPRAAGRTIAERAAAVLALVTLAGAIAVLFAGAIANWAEMLLALLGVLVAVTAGWCAVSRRGAVRLAALAFVAGSVAVLVWGLLVSDLRPPGRADRGPRRGLGGVRPGGSAPADTC